MDEKFKSETFENWDNTKGDINLLNISKMYCKNFKEAKNNGLGFIIYGPPGNGKTYTANCIADAEIQIKMLYSLLASTANETFRFYEYNVDKKVVKDIVKQAYKGRRFSENVWENERETAKYMKKQLYGFIKGEVNVNKITSNITKLFNNSHYKAYRLAKNRGCKGSK